MAEKKTNGQGRTRNYATVLYPESAVENWLDILTQEHIPTFISPLHDKDENPTGENKKEHYHILIMFDSVKTMEQAIEVFNKIGGVGCEVVKSIRGYARYLCHLDNPEKAQYSVDDVKMLCGADYYSIINLVIDKFKAIKEMQDFCDKYDVVSFYALSNYAKDYRPEWHRVLLESSTLYMKEWLSSRKWSKDNDCMVIVDPETGEVIDK